MFKTKWGEGMSRARVSEERWRCFGIGLLEGYRSGADRIPKEICVGRDSDCEHGEEAGA